MKSNFDGSDAHSGGLRRPIDRRRFLALCGVAAATLVVASCGNADSGPEVEQVSFTNGQIPVDGGEPIHSEEGRVYLIHNDERLLALYSRCTHQGCTVQWKSDRQVFACPCHGSTFDRNGVRMDGPAKRPLDLMAVRPQPDGSVVIDTGDITRREE